MLDGFFACNCQGSGWILRMVLSVLLAAWRIARGSWCNSDSSDTEDEAPGRSSESSGLCGSHRMKKRLGPPPKSLNKFSDLALARR